MNLIIVNWLIDTLFKFTIFYLVLKIIEESIILKVYWNDTESKLGFGRKIIILDVITKIIMYLCLIGIIIWVYFNLDIYIPIMNGGIKIDLV